MTTSASGAGSDYNAKIINEFRANQGRVGGPWADTTLILVHHIGANPRITVDVGAQTFTVLADELAGAELWPKLVAQYPTLGEHQAKTTRQFPVFILTQRYGDGDDAEHGRGEPVAERQRPAGCRHRQVAHHGPAKACRRRPVTDSDLGARCQQHRRSDVEEETPTGRERSVSGGRNSFTERTIGRCRRPRIGRQADDAPTSLRR